MSRGTDPSVVFFGLFLMLLTWLIGLTVRSRQKAFRAMGERLARRLGGTLAPGSWPVLFFPILGRAAQLYWGRSEDEGGSFTYVSVDLRGQSPGVLKILPEGFGSRIAKLFGAQDLRLGDDDFDRRFVVKANPESLARRLFSAERRPRVLAVALRFDRRLRIDLSREQLRVSVPESLQLEKDLHLLAQTAVEFVGFLMELEVSGGLWVEDLRIGKGRCPVFGSEMREHLVSCSRCRMPHHEECWSYTGICSTYGCRERRAVRA